MSKSEPGFAPLTETTRDSSPERRMIPLSSRGSTSPLEFTAEIVSSIPAPCIDNILLARVTFIDVATPSTKAVASPGDAGAASGVGIEEVVVGSA